MSTKTPWTYLSLVLLGLLASALPPRELVASGSKVETPGQLLKKVAAKYAQREKTGEFYRIESRVENSNSFSARVVVERLSRSRWRKEVTAPGYSQIEIADGDSLWRKRSQEWRPPSVSAMLNAVAPGNHLERLSEGHIGKAKRRRLNGRPVLCVQVRENGTFVSVCFDEDTHHLAEIKWIRSDYRYSFGSTRELDEQNWYPEEIIVTGPGSGEVRATLLTAERKPSTSAGRWIVPEGASKWAWCADRQAPRILWQPPRVLTDALPYQAFLVVDTEGRPTQIKIFGDMSEADRRRAEKKVRQTRFSPAMCGDQPVRAEYFLPGTW